MSTEYNHQRLITIFTIIGATGLVAIFSVFASIVLNNTSSVLDSINNTDNSSSDITSEQQQTTPTPFPTINVATPTPLPTLTEEQLNTFIGELNSNDPELFGEVPNEALSELEQAVEQSKNTQPQESQ